MKILIIFTFYFLLSISYLHSQESSNIYPRLDIIPFDCILSTDNLNDTLLNGIIITGIDIRYYFLVPLFYIADDSLYISCFDKRYNDVDTIFSLMDSCSNVVIPMKYVKELRIFPPKLYNKKEMYIPYILPHTFFLKYGSRQK